MDEYGNDKKMCGRKRNTDNLKSVPSSFHHLLSSSFATHFSAMNSPENSKHEGTLGASLLPQHPHAHFQPTASRPISGVFSGQNPRFGELREFSNNPETDF
jgi:hypothetical protein